MNELPVPAPTPETLPYWEAARERRLRLPQCDDCDAYHFYPRGACPFCHSTSLTWNDVSGRGSLYSYVINHRPPPAFADRGPIVIAVVELEEGPRMLTNIVGVDPEPEQLPLDMQLVADFEPRGEYALTIFRPANEAEADS